LLFSLHGRGHGRVHGRGHRPGTQPTVYTACTRPRTRPFSRPRSRPVHGRDDRVRVGYTCTRSVYEAVYTAHTRPYTHVHGPYMAMDTARVHCCVLGHVHGTYTAVQRPYTGRVHGRLRAMYSAVYMDRVHRRPCRPIRAAHVHGRAHVYTDRSRPCNGRGHGP